MSAFVNDIDALLDAAPVRNLDPRAGRVLLLSVDVAGFHVDAAGLALPLAAVFRAELVGIKGSAEFSVIGGDLIGSSDNERALAAASMTGVTATVTATVVYQGETYSDSKTVTRTVDGVNAALSPEQTEAIAQIPGILGQITDLEEIYGSTVSAATSAAQAALDAADAVAAKAAAIISAAVATDKASQSEQSSVTAQSAKDNALSAASAAGTAKTSAETAASNAASAAIASQESRLAADAAFAQANQKAAAAVTSAQQASTFADASGASAAAAHQSALEAAASASGSAGEAGGSANAAAQSAASAAASANAASQSASASQTSRLAAESASNAASQAQSGASNSASGAATSASNASSSEAAAFQSAQLAAQSKSGADQSALAASGSASTASTKAGEASSSASAASASANTASTRAGDAATYRDQAAQSSSTAYGYAQASAYDRTVIYARLDSIGGSGVSVEQKLSVQADSITGLQGRASLEVNVGGTVTGIRAYGTSGGVSALDFSANNVTFSAPGVAPKYMFTLATVNGVTTIGLHGDVVVDGSLTTRVLAANAVSNADKFTDVSTSCTFVSYVPFTIQLTVYQYTDPPGEFGSSAGEWVFEFYTDQGAGYGYWTTVHSHSSSTMGNRFVETFVLAANVNPTYPNYRIRKVSGYNLDVSVLKFFK